MQTPPPFCFCWFCYGHGHHRGPPSKVCFFSHNTHTHTQVRLMRTDCRHCKRVFGAFLIALPLCRRSNVFLSCALPTSYCPSSRPRHPPRPQTTTKKPPLPPLPLPFNSCLGTSTGCLYVINGTLFSGKQPLYRLWPWRRTSWMCVRPWHILCRG